jgi:hypothetical protein
VNSKEDLQSRIAITLGIQIWRRAWGLAQVVEGLHSKCKSLTSNPTTTREREKEKKSGEGA